MGEREIEGRRDSVRRRRRLFGPIVGRGGLGRRLRRFGVWSFEEGNQ